MVGMLQRITPCRVPGAVRPLNPEEHNWFSDLCLQPGGYWVAVVPLALPDCGR
jgi:hypothetical protein